MTKREEIVYKHRRAFERNNWDIGTKKNHISPNEGAESTDHLKAKLATLIALENQDYRVASEIERTVGSTTRYLDVCGYGIEDRHVWAIELENNLDDDTRSRKIQHYLHSPITEIEFFDPGELGNTVEAMATEIHQTLFGDSL